MLVSGCLLPHEYADCTITGHVDSSYVGTESDEQRQRHVLRVLDRLALAEGFAKFGVGHTGQTIRPESKLALAYRPLYADHPSLIVTAEDTKSIPVVRINEQNVLGSTVHTAESLARRLHKELPNLDFFVEVHRYQSNDF